MVEIRPLLPPRVVSIAQAVMGICMTFEDLRKRFCLDIRMSVNVDE